MSTIRKHRGKWQSIIRVQGHPLISKVFVSKTDASRWASDEDKRAGLLEFELADEYWRGLYEEYKKKGGTLNFKEFMEEQTSTSSKNGIKSILRI